MNEITLSSKITARIAQNVYIAFIDILGFTELVKAQNWNENLDKVFTVVENSIRSTKTAQTSGIVPNDPLRSLFVSDSIILWQKPNDDEDWKEKAKALRFLLHAVEKIQFECAKENIWMRGGISYGKVLFDQNNTNIGGPAYLKALGLEKVADFPRVIVDAKIVSETFSHVQSRKDYLREINQKYKYEEYSGKFLYDFGPYPCTGSTFIHDYPFFVHYLNRLSSEDEQGQKNLNAIWENLRKNIFANSPSIFRKYQWVLEYLEHYSKHLPGSHIKTKFVQDHI